MLLGDDKIEQIDQAGRHILAHAGVRLLSEGVLKRLHEAGASVDLNEGIVRFTGEWLDEIVGNAPRMFTLYSRDGMHDLNIGSGSVYFGNGGRVFRILDMNTGGFRLTVLKDVAHTARLVNLLENIHFYIIACQAHDISSEFYHLNDFFQAFRNTSKHVMGGCDSLQGVRQMWNLACAVAGDEKRLQSEPFVSVITNPISPLTLDNNTLEILEFCALKGIPVTCAPAPMAGATSPVTLAGTLAQMHAESLAGVALTQVFRPGAPVLYGAVPTAMDMRTMDLTFGSVETAMMNVSAVQLAKRYHVPIYASAGMTDAKTPDIQSGFEKGVSLLLVGMAGAEFIHLAAGMLDSGNSISYEQFIIDNEILGMVYRVLRGIEVNENTLAVECVEKLGPGGNYMMEDHTVEHMFDEFFFPSLSVRMNFDLWKERNEPTPLSSARELARELLQNNEPVLSPDEIVRIEKQFPDIVNV